MDHYAYQCPRSSGQKGLRTLGDFMPPSGDWEAEGSGVKVLATIKTVELSQRRGINLTKTWGCRGESCKCEEDEPPGLMDGETVEEGSEAAEIVDEESGSEHEWKTVDKQSEDGARIADS